MISNFLVLDSEETAKNMLFWWGSGFSIVSIRGNIPSLGVYAWGFLAASELLGGGV